MRKVMLFFAAVSLVVANGFIAIPASAEDLPACKNLGNAKISGVSTDVPENVKALMCAWEGEWTLEGSRTAPPRSSIVFTGIKDGSVSGVYVFNGQVQTTATSFSIDGDNAVSYQ